MKTVTLFAFIGSPNLGDEAINLAIMKSFADSEHILRVVSLDSTKTEALAKVALLKNYEIISARKRRLVWDAIRTCDLFVCGGGGIIQDQTSIYNLPNFLGHILIALGHRRPVMLYGVGVGPLQSRISRFLVKAILNRVDRITVRDLRSRSLLLAVGVRGRLIEVTADPAIGLMPGNKPPLSLEPNRMVIVVCLRHWFDIRRILPVALAVRLGRFNGNGKRLYRHFVTAVAATLDHALQQLEAQVVFLPFWFGRDTVVHRDVYEAMKQKQNVLFFNEVADPLVALSIIDGADLVLGMRLHALIFGASLGKRLLAIGYSNKVDNFLETVVGRHHTRQLIADPGDFSSEELINKLEYSRSADYLSELQQNVRQLKLAETRNFLLAQDILQRDSATPDPTSSGTPSGTSS